MIERIKKNEERLDNVLLSIKAGVLSEDRVWNMNEDIDYLIKEMNKNVLEFANSIN